MSQRVAEQQILAKVRQGELIASVVRDAIRWGALAWIAYMTKEAIAVLAGKQTIAVLAARFFADLTVSHTLAFSFGASGIAFGLWQKKLRRDTVQALGARNAELEQLIDPRRTSSRLTIRGDTNPGDRT